MSYLPTAPKPVSFENRAPRVFLGIGWGLRITNDDAEESPTRLNQKREAKERKVRAP